MCILCEKTEFQDQSCGLGVEQYTNFQGELKKSKIVSEQDLSQIIETLTKEHEIYLDLVALSRKNDFALNEQNIDIIDALDKEQNYLFGSILVHTKIQERNAGALK